MNIGSVFVPTVGDVCVRGGQFIDTKNSSGFGLVKTLKLKVKSLNGRDLQTKIRMLKVCIVLDSDGKYSDVS